MAVPVEAKVDTDDISSSEQRPPTSTEHITSYIILIIILYDTHTCVCVCVCVCARARACVRACVRAWVRVYRIPNIGTCHLQYM